MGGFFPSAGGTRGWTFVAVVVLLVAIVPAKSASGGAHEVACPNAEIRPLTLPERRAAGRATRCQINLLRERFGLARVHPDHRVRQAARRHAHDMVRRRYFSHTSLGGRTMAGRLARTGYAAAHRSWAIGEVLAWGTGSLQTPAATVRAWLRSPSHRRVLLDPRYRDIGIGVAVGNPVVRGQRGATYTVDFGRRP